MFIRVILLGAFLALAACASTDYGYAYCYDPYRGPVGYYTGPFEPKPACATQRAPAGVFVAREGDARRGPYLSGPYPMPVAEGAVDAASREATR